MKEIRREARFFCSSDDKRAWIEIFGSFFLFAVPLYIAVSTVYLGVIWLPFAVLAALGAVRLYMMHHDCTHMSLFRSRRTNEIVGTILSGPTLTPYKATRLAHLLHHKHVGNIDERDAFEIKLLTLEEYNEAHWVIKLLYRAYRGKIVLIFIGPIVFFLFVRRFPRYGKRTGVGNVLICNLLVVGQFGLVFWIGGWPGVLVYLFVIWVATIFGGMIPYLVHNFEDMQLSRGQEWEFENAAINGSAILDFGRLFDFVTANIAYHDLHHLEAGIPCYNLRRCHRLLEDKRLLRSTRVTLRDVVDCFDLKLYDENLGRMIPFPQKMRSVSGLRLNK